MAITQRSELNQPDATVNPSAKGVTSGKNGIWFSSFEMCRIRWRQRKSDSNRAESNGADAVSKGSGRREVAPQRLSPAHLRPPELRRTLPVNSEECSAAFVPASPGPTVPLVTRLPSSKPAAGCQSCNPNLFPLGLLGSNPAARRRGLTLGLRGSSTSDTGRWTAVQHSIPAALDPDARRSESLWHGRKMLSVPG